MKKRRNLEAKTISGTCESLSIKGSFGLNTSYAGISYAGISYAEISYAGISYPGIISY